MGNWESYLNENPIDWLLEDNNPSVRYFTLTELLDKPQDDFEVKKARKNIMKIGVVPKILSKQNKGGYWGPPQNFYLRGKYKGTSWQIIVLAELGANGKDERIQKTCEFLFKNSQDPLSGGFSYLSNAEGIGDHEKVLPCLTANMVWSFIRLGYWGDERLEMAIEWILNYQRFDDEAGQAPDEWPYKRWKICYGERTCHSIIVKSLKAFTEIPENKKTPEIKEYMANAAEHMLNHHIHKRNYPPSKGRFKWLEFGFPLMWSIDALEVLGILSKLGYKDNRMMETMDIMISKQNTEGKWILENTFNGRVQAAIERKNQPSKWITLNAIKVLKNFYG
ncbi:nitrogen fixation protein NifH [Methanobacterium alcaliphilum]|uniref:nitrogen fixation protein NifH n=1 Tax=Methanobacterium alcaliphilum TaxID=392018 RepID=UPI00200A3B31|nr:nitrogen fixation protein NifH [Methanobacterium alcaliphilum]MCK9150537.1 nitrogen fixation protein NifH [Methanobacterium alcaliphilum]